MNKLGNFERKVEESSIKINDDKVNTNSEPRKGKKGKDVCFICEKYVLNFARHIKRNHSMDKEVQKTFTLAVNSKERKDSLY